MIKILAGVILVLLLIVGGLGWYAKATTERAATASRQADAYRIALDAQNRQLADYGDRLMAREAERQAAEQRAAEWRRKWRIALNDKRTSDWAADPLPPVVAARVRELSAPYPSDATADRAPDGPDSDSDLRD